MTYYKKSLLAVSLLLFVGLHIANAQSKNFTLQVEAVDNPTVALELVKQLKLSGIDNAYYLKTYVPGKGTYYRVRVGNFADTYSAQKLGSELQRKQLIQTYYVARFEGQTALSKESAGYTSLKTNQTNIGDNFSAAPYEKPEDNDLSEYDNEEEDGARTGAVPPKTKAVRPPQKKQIIIKRIMPTRITHDGGIITGQGNVPVRVPFEQDDIGGSCFFISTGAAVSSENSFGLFTVRDQVLGAIIPYDGAEAELKFKAHINQQWTPPKGIIAADLFKMEVRGHYREFQAAADPLTTIPLTGGRIPFKGLTPGAYMLRGRTSHGKCVFLPITVKE